MDEHATDFSLDSLAYGQKPLSDEEQMEATLGGLRLLIIASVGVAALVLVGWALYMLGGLVLNWVIDLSSL